MKPGGMLTVKRLRFPCERWSQAMFSVTVQSGSVLTMLILTGR